MADTVARPVYRITDLQQAERPRERLERLGAVELSDEELIAILLRIGVPGENAVEVGRRLLKHFGGLRGLYEAPFVELMNQHGIGEAKAAQIKAAIELGRRLSLPGDDETINGPGDAAARVQYEMSALAQ